MAIDAYGRPWQLTDIERIYDRVLERWIHISGACDVDGEVETYTKEWCATQRRSDGRWRLVSIEIWLDYVYESWVLVDQ